MEVVIILASLASLASFAALVACAIIATQAVKKIAAEAAQLRRILGVVAETQFARGDNEIASIQAANGLAESIHLHSMPRPQGETEQGRRAAKINNIMRQ